MRRFDCRVGGGVEYSSEFACGLWWCCGDASLEGYEVDGGAGARTLAPSEVKFLIGCATGYQIIYIAAEGRML